MLIDKEIITVNILGINVDIKRLSYTDFCSIAFLLKQLAVKDMYDILINENYKKCHLIDIKKKWLIKAIQFQFKYLGSVLSYLLAFFIVKKGSDDLFFLKLSQEGVLIYLDGLLKQKYYDYFDDDDNKNINKILYNNLKSQGILEVLLTKGGININKLSHIEYLKYSNSKSIKMIQILSGLTLEEDEKENDIYTFNSEKYIKDLLLVMRGYLAKEIKNKSVDLNYDNMFNDNIELIFKNKIGKNSWGKNKSSKEYIFCKYSK